MKPVRRIATLILVTLLPVIVLDAQQRTKASPRPAMLSLASTQDVGTKLEPAPTLQPFPSNSQLEPTAKDKVDKALKNYANDQVSAYLTLREVSEDKKANLSEGQRKWLEGVLPVLKLRTIAVLNYDLGIARTHSDFRGAYIVSLTLLSVAETNSEVVTGLSATFPTLSDLMKKSFQQEPEPVWEITDAAGEFMSSYREGPNIMNQIEVTPGKDGYRFLRVRAQVANISKRSDPPYTGWALGFFKRISLEDDRDKMTKASRLAGDTFIHAVTLDYAQSFPCTFVTRENKILRSSTVFMDSLEAACLGQVVTPRRRQRLCCKTTAEPLWSKALDSTLTCSFLCRKGSTVFD